MPLLSIVVVSFNTKDITFSCLHSLLKSLKQNNAIGVEIIVVDNGSKDGSVAMLEKLKEEIQSNNNTVALEILKNKHNIGYAKGNNYGIQKAKGRYVLLLNSDVIVEQVNFPKIISFMEKNKDVGILTVKVLLTNSMIDPASHRGFPNLWNSFCYFSGLEKLLGKVPVIGKLFGGYHLTTLDLTTPHEIDSPSGAFFLTRKRILNDIGAFDEMFFMYGEDLDLALRIKQSGYRVLYYPLYTIVHIKYASGLQNENGEMRKHMKERFYDSMKLFYRKHYAKQYPELLNTLVYNVIDLKKRLS